jgi:hypothetical protein
MGPIGPGEVLWAPRAGRVNARAGKIGRTRTGVKIAPTP